MPTSDWSPALGTVGAILRARTRDTSGTEVGTFSAETQPTGTQVARLVEQASGDLASAVGSELRQDLWGQASVVAAYRTAMLVELSFFPEQVARGTSPYAQLRELYNETLKDLRIAVDSAGGDVPGAPSGGVDPEAPAYAFLSPASPLDAVLGLLPVGPYTQPYGGGLYQ